MDADTLVLRGSVGSGGVNRPDDVKRVKERLLKLGFEGIKNFRSQELAGHTGFVNVDRVFESEGFFYGTSWLADVLVKAGEHYRKNYLENNRLKAPIAVNDASKFKGTGNYPHKSHDSGMALDIKLPHLDGTWGGITFLAAQYDRDAMEAVTDAFFGTEMVQVFWFNDSILASKVKDKYDLVPMGGHDNHLHVSIKPPDRGQPKTNPIELTLAVGRGGQANDDDLKAVWDRLNELRFPTGETIPTKDNPEPKLFIYAIELFQAAVNGLGSPSKLPKDGKGSIKPLSDDLKWLNAENAPHWQKIPVGTIEIFDRVLASDELKKDLQTEVAQCDDVVVAIRRFQGIINGIEPDLDSNKPDGVIQPDRKTHRWLKAGNAPNWVPLVLPAVYEMAQSDIHTSSWLVSILENAAPKGDSKIQIAEVRATGCDFVLPIQTDGSLNVEAAKTIFEPFTHVVEPAIVKMYCEESVANQIEGCKTDNSVPQHIIRLRVQPPEMLTEPIPLDRPPVVRLQPADSGKPSLALVPGATAGEEFLALILPGAQDDDDEEIIGVQLPFRVSNPHDQINGDKDKTPVRIKTDPTESLPYPTVTLPELPNLDFEWSPQPAPQHVMTLAAEEASVRRPGVRVESASLSLHKGATPHLTFEIEVEVPGLHTWHWQHDLDLSLSNLTGLWYGGERIVGDAKEVVEEWVAHCWLCAQFKVQIPLASPGMPLKLDSSGADVVIYIGVSDGGQLDIELSGEIGSLSFDLGSPLARLELVASGQTPPGLSYSLSTVSGFSLTLPDTITSTLRLDLFDRFGGLKEGPVVNNIWSPVEAPELKLLNLKFEANELSKLREPPPVTETANGATQSVAAQSVAPQLGALSGLTDHPAPGAAAREAQDQEASDDESDATDPLTLTWRDNSPLIDPELLSALVDKMSSALADAQDWVNDKRQLLSLSGMLPVVGDQMKVTFVPPKEKSAFQLEPDPTTGWALLVRLGMKVEGAAGPILTGEGDFRFLIDKEETGLAHLKPGALRLSRSEVVLQTDDDYPTTFGELLLLRIPKNSCFHFSCDPKDPYLAWDADASLKNTRSKITLSLPKDGTNGGQFTFEMDRFRIHSAGIDLRGAVLSGSVKLGEPQTVGFAEPVGVKSVQRKTVQPNDSSATAPTESPPHRIGEIEIKNSQLVYGSLQASCKLPYFDDATGTLTLMLSQGKDESLACAGTLDISGIDEFHIDTLYTTVQVDHLQFSTSYTTKGWNSNASLTGRLKFQPPKGRSAGEMGEMAKLFEGVTLEFENLNPIQGSGNWELRTPPKRFTLADILFVDLRGVNLKLDNWKVKGCELLGDISIQQLPGINAALTFGGISLESNGSKPKFTIKKIGAQFSSPGGFRMSGVLEHIRTPGETGFGGSFTLKVNALPELGGMLKLTRVKLENGAVAPSLAVFVERETEVELLYGFYLRRLGIGVGVRQALRGLEPNGSVSPTKRLLKFVDNPAGLPDPIMVDNWKPVQRQKLSWMLVGAGLITFGNLPEDEAHLIAGSFLLSIDQDLRLMLGANLWLFTSPRETRDARFIERPVARGAMELSVRDGYLRAYMRTIKGPRLGKQAPPLLAEVLSEVETTLFYQVDRNGFIAEIGWPWETRIKYKMGEIFKGSLQTGYRYGLYRGVLVYGLNFAMSVQLAASQSLSFGVRGASAEARLEVNGEADFRASFVGALDTTNMLGYLMGDVRLDALVSVRASARARIKISKWIKISISFSATLTVSIRAALTAAMDSRPTIGFEGTAQVAISVCGYGISGSVAFSYKPEVIGKVRETLNDLLFRRDESGDRALEARGLVAGGATPEKSLWQYRFHWIEPVKEGMPPRLRVLLIPDDYPKLPPNDHESRFSLKLQRKDLFRQFAGNKKHVEPNAEDRILWSEDLQERLPLTGLDDEDTARAYLVERKAELEETLADAGWNGDQIRKLEQELEKDTGALEELEAKLAETLGQAGWNGDQIKELEQELDGVGQALKDVKTALKDESESIEVINGQTLGTLLAESGWVKPLRGDNEHKVKDHRIDPNYDTRLAQASNPSDDQKQLPPPPPDDQNKLPPLPPGLLLAELLTLLKDPGVQAGQDANKPGQDANDKRPPVDRYRAAHLMKLVLEFEPPEDWRKRRDPVPDLIDLNSMIAAAQSVRLEPVLGLDAPPVEYDLIPGPVHQEPGRICLTWDFVREDEVQGARQGAGSDDFAPYAELDEYIVTRHNLGRPNDRPRVVATRPAWIVQREGKGASASVFYLRPPFQFIDDQLENVQEGHFLQYRIVAHATDRVLAATLIDVTRKTVEPLPTVGQALALHTFTKEGKPAIVFIVPAWDPDVDKGEQAADPNELVIGYRFVPAARLGAYGYDLRPASPMRWVDGLPARRDVPEFPEIKFAESGEGRAVPWEETTLWPDPNKLPNTNEPPKPEWTPKTFTYHDPRDGQDVTKHWFRCQVTTWPQPQPQDGQAIEFYIGRHRKPGDRNPVEEKSDLIKCRHAVAASEPNIRLRDDGTVDLNPANTVDAFEPQSWLRGDGTLDLNMGSTVDAFERLQQARAGAEFIEPKYMQLTVVYPDIPEPPPASGNAQAPATDNAQKDADPPLPPEIVLTWRHDQTDFQTDLQDGSNGDPFDPVIGYRIHLLDRYDPAEYPLPPVGNLPERPLVTVRAIPDRLYRATPETIVVEGVPTRPLDEAPTDETAEARTKREEAIKKREQERSNLLDNQSLREPQTIDQELQVRLIEIEGGEFEPNWVSITEAERPLTPTEGATEGLTLVPSKKSEAPRGETPEARAKREALQDLLWDAGPIYLQNSLIKVLTGLATDLGAKCRLILHHPLEQRVTVRAANAGDAASEQATADATDAAALTALIDQLASQLDGRSDPYGWWLAEALGMSCECILLDGDGVPIAAEIIRDHLASGIPASCSVAFFRADDGRTLLNVLRVTADKRDDQAVKAVTEALSHITGIKDPEPGDDLIKKLLDRLIPDPMATSAWALKEPAKLREFVRSVRVAVGDEVKPTVPASVELPIAADGTLTYRWQVPDLWGHRYVVAIETIRRHDALWRLLNADRPKAQPPTAADAAETAQVQPAPLIQTKHFKEILVSRTKELVEHNLIVTPLPGSIQALVFRHPAAFAAAASAVNAIHGQYAGQTVILERRIGKRLTLVGIYEALGEDFWRTWKEPESDPPQPSISIWKDESKSVLPFKPIDGAELGVYGADRYVYPDLPGYYQYRVAVYSSAGKRQSPVAVSGWVDPIYDEARQRPKASKPISAVFTDVTDDTDDISLDMKLPVLSAAQHLPAELRKLWSDVEERVNLSGVDEPVKFGDLPDLYLTYQVYLRTNPLDESTAVYVPFCRFVGPMSPQDNAGKKETLGYNFDLQAPIGKDDGTFELTAGALTAGVLTPGALNWHVHASFKNLADPSLLAGLKSAPEKAAEFIAVAVQRKGVWSKPVTGGDTNPFDI